MVIIKQRFGKHCDCHLQVEHNSGGPCLEALYKAGFHNRPTVTLEMATAASVETLHNYQHSMQPNLASGSYTLNSSSENVRKRIKLDYYYCCCYCYYYCCCYCYYFIADVIAAIIIIIIIIIITIITPFRHCAVFHWAK
jgi:hypothetical protein